MKFYLRLKTEYKEAEEFWVVINFERQQIFESNAFS